MKFDELSLHPDLLKAIQEMGYTELTDIQEQCIKPGLEGRDIAGVSQTGTGKTLAFLMPVLENLFQNPVDTIHTLIVSPTRELCLQITEEAQKLCQFNSVEVVPIYGGEDYNKQEARLAKKPSIIVATPGRLIDYMKQNKVDTSSLQFLILDEADRMLDMGFIRDVRYIMRHVPQSAHTYLFSATLSYYIMRLASDFMHDPVEVRVEGDSVAVDKIDQYLLHLSRDEKEVYLLNQLLSLDEPRVIIFSNYKHAVERIVKLLHKYGIAATGLSSLLDQKKRLKLLKGFKLGQYQVLVATDVASRGLDVDDITHVINFDLPQDAESYVHRIGRTARAGKSGISYSYCSENDYENLPRIKRYINQDIPVAEMNVEWCNWPKGDFRRFHDPDRQKGNSPREGQRHDKKRDDRSNRKRKRPDRNKDSQNKKDRPQNSTERSNSSKAKQSHENQANAATVRERDRQELLKRGSANNEKPQNRERKQNKKKPAKQNNRQQSRTASNPNQTNSIKRPPRPPAKTRKRQEQMRKMSQEKKGVWSSIKGWFKKDSTN